MATTTLTKQYVLDRMDARIVSLKSKIVEAEKKISQYDERDVRANLVAARKDIARLVRLVNEELNDFTEEHVKGTIPLETLYEHVFSLRNQIVGTANNRSVDGGGVRSLLLPTSRTPGRAHNAPTEVNTALQTVRDAPREIANLEHARAYLVESPADTFSISSLKQLGLLDVIRFSL